MKMIKTLGLSLALAATTLLTTIAPAQADTLPTDKTVIGFSHYTGWELYAYIRDFGIMNAVNKAFGTNVDIRFYGTYGASLNDFAGGAIHGVAMTNMDALITATTVPVIASVNGDTSDANDAIVSYGINSCSEMKGKRVYLYEKSVSHYLLNRYLSTCGLTDMDVVLKHVEDDGTMPTVFTTMVKNKEQAAIVTWNPPLQVIMQNPNGKTLYTSADIRGEILDSMYVRADGSVSDNTNAAINEMWYRATKIMTTRGAKRNEMISFMADFSGATPSEFQGQMKTTRFFTTKASAMKEITSPSQKTTMSLIGKFVEEQDLLGDYSDISEIGIQLADGTVIGDKDNIVMTFTTKFLK
jgi:NitT/TauT family transport system substrate-binding protein